MNVNFDINAMLKSVIEDFQNIARNVKISFKIHRLKDDIFDAFNDTWKTRNLKRNVRTSSKSRRLNEDNHRLNGETDCHCKHKQGPRGILCTRGETE